jgi:hypothetical protein
MDKQELQEIMNYIAEAQHLAVGEHAEIVELLGNALRFLSVELSKSEPDGAIDDRQYLAKFRQGNDPMSMNAIDFYMENGEIIEHKWAMGGQSMDVVESVPDKIDGYERIYP